MITEATKLFFDTEPIIVVMSFFLADAPRVTITEQSPYMINVGSVEVLYCQVSGKPIPTVQWYKGDTPVTPLSSNFLLVPTDSPPTTVYTCEGINYAGNKKHVGFANITIIVKGKFKL